MIKLAFKGVKKLTYPFPLSHTPNIKDFWHKLFEDYYFPICPLCDKEMNCRIISIEYQINVASSFSSPQGSKITSSRVPSIEVVFSCECGTEMEGEGFGITINQDMSFVLDEIAIIKVTYTAKKESQ